VTLGQTGNYGIGRVATPQEIQAWDISISPDGKELPPGSGTAKGGAQIYAQKCAACHGRTGVEAPAGPRLVGDRATLGTLQPQKSVGSYWPFATQIWDFIKESDVVDANSLPKIQMPNRDGFVPPQFLDILDYRGRRGCRSGTCP
jgi:cytochrome c